MKTSLKLLLLIPFSILAGCASRTVKMTPDEVQSYLAKAPEMRKFISENNRSALTRQQDYCETLSGPCWKVECIGSAMSETKCWKTPYNAFGISTESDSQVQGQTLAQLMATCQSNQEDAAKRRASCFDYFSYLQKIPSEKRDDKNVAGLLKQFCDMKDVACTFHFSKFGKGDLNTDGLRSSAFRKGIYEVNSKTDPGSKETYEYIILKQ